MAIEIGAITVSEKAKEKVLQLIRDSNLGEDYFLRVGVVGGGCSGLSYKLDFDNEIQPKDQVFEDNGIKLVTDLKSYLYLCDTVLDFTDGLNGKGFISLIRMQAVAVAAEKALLYNI